MPTWWRCGARTAPTRRRNSRSRLRRGPGTPNWMWPVAVTRGVSGGDRRRRLSVFHQDSRCRQPRGDRRRRAMLHAGALSLLDALHRRRRCTDAAAALPAAAASPDRVKSSRPRRCRSSATSIRLSLAGEYANGGGLQGLRPQSRMASPASSAASRAKKPQKTPRWNSARSAPTLFSRRGNARFMSSATRVVYPHGRPPMPSLPWIRRDPSIEKPFAAKDMPLVHDPGKARLESNYVPGKKSKSIAVGPGGQFIFYTGGETTGESVRRTLETCGALAGVACMIVAIDDAFVVPLPTAFKVTGFFRGGQQFFHRSGCERRCGAQARGGVVRMECGRGRRVRTSGTWRSRRRTNRMRSTTRSAIAPSPTAIATSSRSARFRSGLN